MVEIFRTNVTKSSEAKRIVRQISIDLPNSKINFCLDDCDRILRVETANGSLNANAVIEIVKRNKFHCEILPD